MNRMQPKPGLYCFIYKEPIHPSYENLLGSKRRCREKGIPATLLMYECFRFLFMSIEWYSLGNTFCIMSSRSGETR